MDASDRNEMCDLIYESVTEQIGLGATSSLKYLNEIAAEIKCLRLSLDTFLKSLTHGQQCAIKMLEEDIKQRDRCLSGQPPPKWIDPREI